jgi:Holliday junction resolvase-like predicted endonuclease
MLLKNIRATPRQSINKKSLNLVLPKNTVKLLEGLENTCNDKHLLGLLAEIEVIQIYLKKGYSLHSHRKKYFHTEVDVIMESLDKMILIEVKYTTHSDFLSHRMSRIQKKRLENVFLRVIQMTKKEVEFHYVIASQSGEYQVFDEFLSD